MNSTEKIINKLKLVKDGFKPIRQEAQVYISSHSQEECLNLAYQLYTSTIYQARMMATLIMASFASRDPKVFAFLRNTVSKDPDWRTQEMLAMAFNQYCQDIGYEKAITDIKDWLKDKNHNVRRAVTEGLRIWTHRDYFKQHPDLAIALLSSLKNDEHEYVRKSVGNALRDISRFHKELVARELSTWDKTDKKITYTYTRACKFIKN